MPIGEGDALRLPTLADMAQLRQLVEATAARLVIVDVLMAYLPISTDSHKDQDIRSVLARLAALADASGATVLLPRHLNKGKGGDPLYRGGGSIGIIGAARAGMLVAPDPDTPERVVLAWAKSNLAPTPDSLNYRLVNTPEHGCARLVWDGASSHTAHTLLAETTTGEAIPAKHFVRDYLETHGGEAHAAGVLKAGRITGFSEQELKDARRRSSKPQITSRKSSWDDGWVWAIDPAITSENDPDEGGNTPPVTCKMAKAVVPNNFATSQVNEGGVPPSSFVNPVGPDRCDECGFHMPTQGHRDTCSKHEGKEAQ